MQFHPHRIRNKTGIMNEKAAAVERAYLNATDVLVERYKRLSIELAQAEKNDWAKAGDIAVEMSSLCAKYINDWSKHMDSATSEFVRREVVGLASHATLCRTMQMNSIGDMALSRSGP